MRWLLVVSTLCACDAGAPAPTPTPTPTPVPVPIVEEARPRLYELIRDVPGTEVRVSSQVKNPRIVPGHLIDRDMQTAWNSRTNQLTGTWLEVTAPQGGRIHELRLTVGHTGTGQRGEDYFTMNPRIAKVLVDTDNVDFVWALDSTSRALQSIPVDATRVRLTIAELRPGTKREWREVAISELEALGTIPEPRSAQAITPKVTVADDVCAAVPKRDPADCTSGCTEGHCVPDGLPDCFKRPVDVEGARPWAVPTVACEIENNERGPTRCAIHLETAAALVLAVPLHEARTYPAAPKARLADIVAGGLPELVITYEGLAGDEVVVCRAEPLACTAPASATTALSHTPVFR